MHRVLKQAKNLSGISEEVAKEIGVALIIAAILDATIDVFLKIAIVRDVFYAAFSYVMHPTLKEKYPAFWSTVYSLTNTSGLWRSKE
jgi:hypothetical protein